MIVVNPPSAFIYPQRTLERAKIALLCSPFSIKLFSHMRTSSVSVPTIALSSGVEHGYTTQPLSELAVDNDLNWLIQVGMLRREVDGQGITDSFRLTPLGRQLVEEYQKNPPRPVTNSDRLSNAINRWLRLPF